MKIVGSRFGMSVVELAQLGVERGVVAVHGSWRNPGCSAGRSRATQHPLLAAPDQDARRARDQAARPRPQRAIHPVVARDPERARPELGAVVVLDLLRAHAAGESIADLL